MENIIKAYVDSITFPKSEALIIPANTAGLMSRGQITIITDDGGPLISQEAKGIASSGNFNITDCFTTGVGRLKRRGLKKLYHSIIKRYQNDFTSTGVVFEALDKALKKVVEDGWKSVTVCAMGIENGELDISVIARETVTICKKYTNQISIKIIDSNVEFITEVNKTLGNGENNDK